MAGHQHHASQCTGKGQKGALQQWHRQLLFKGIEDVVGDLQATAGTGHSQPHDETDGAKPHLRGNHLQHWSKQTMMSKQKNG